MTDTACIWCGTEFEPRSNGGSAQRFCSKDCRQDFNTACRIWGAQEYEAERVSIFELRAALGQRACCAQRDLASSRPGAPETGARTDGLLVPHAAQVV